VVIIPIILIGGSTPLKNMSSSVGMIIPYYSQYVEKYKMFQTTNQIFNTIHILTAFSLS
jgi:hypothetical protein